MIRDLELAIVLWFNRSRVIATRSGDQQSHGLTAALDTLRKSPRNAVAIGDAENDRCFESPGSWGRRRDILFSRTASSVGRPSSFFMFPIRALQFVGHVVRYGRETALYFASGRGGRACPKSPLKSHS